MLGVCAEGPWVPCPDKHGFVSLRHGQLSVGAVNCQRFARAAAFAVFAVALPPVSACGGSPGTFSDRSPGGSLRFVTGDAARDDAFATQNDAAAEQEDALSAELGDPQGTADGGQGTADGGQGAADGGQGGGHSTDQLHRGPLPEFVRAISPIRSVRSGGITYPLGRTDAPL